ncbi:MAG TPA: DUF86 domain-containing protein [Treponemataceae bacterium]|nr:DUF86 domain-containing protein [Treponemataceae bacterium]
MQKKIQRLEENLIVLQNIYAQHNLEKIKTDTAVQWSIRYGIMESVQIVIDISCALCSKNNLGSPKSYADCIKKLSQFSYLNQNTASSLVKLAGLRNILVHEYVEIDIERMYENLSDLGIFKQFISEIYKYLP